MRYQGTLNTHPPITIVELYIFDPWPFRESTIKVVGSMSYVNAEHELKTDVPSLWLAQKDNAIALLSDGRRAITNPHANPVGTAVRP